MRQFVAVTNCKHKLMHTMHYTTVNNMKKI